MRLRSIGVVCVVLSALVVPAHPAVADTASGAAYYVDAAAGDDDNSGLDAEHPWQSLSKVNGTTFRPGDRLLLHAGQTWHGQLWPKGSGTAAAPITIGSYETGTRPAIVAGGAVADAVRLWNQQYWTVADLDVSNTRPGTGTPGANLGDLRGIHIGGDNGQTLNNLYVRDVRVHDVTGVVNWIGGSTSGNRTGITFATGWDASKHTGGIVFDTAVTDPADPGTPTILNNIGVAGSDLENNSFAGIIVKQYTGSDPGETHTGWGERTSATDPRWAPHTNVTLTGNYLSQPGTAYGCNGIYLTDTRGGLVENNTVANTGTSGIEMYYDDAITVQHNEIYGTTRKAGGGDSNGIDSDAGTTNVLVQYNYTHNNGYGILLCQFKFGTVTWRYNVIANDVSGEILLAGDALSHPAQVYNNTVYDATGDPLVTGSGIPSGASYVFRNNIFYATSASSTLAGGASITYQHNLYAGAAFAIPVGDTTAVTGDPRFNAPDVTGPYGTATSGPQLATAFGYRPAAGSAAANTATPVADNGGIDYAGATLYNGAPDIGAFEYRTAPGATTESVSGVVTDPAGTRIAGATVTIGAAGTTRTGPTDATGRYVLDRVPFAASATLTVQAAGYRRSDVTVSVLDGNTTTVDLTLTSDATTGTLTGTVVDQTATPLADATVTLTRSGAPSYTATSHSDGTFTLAEVPIAAGYDLAVTKSGYLTQTRQDIAVIAGTTAVPSMLVPSATAQPIASTTFAEFPPGPMTTGRGWTVSPTGGSVTVDRAGGATNHYLDLTRSTNTGSTSAELGYSTPLRGLVTLDEDVQRTDPYTSGADYFALPYFWPATGSTPGIAVAMDQGQFKAYRGATIQNLRPYTAGSWYHLTLQANTVTQTYSLLINGVPVETDAPFRTTMTAISRIQFYANSSNYGQALIDNIQIRYGTPPKDTDAPGKAVISTTQGWANGLRDGNYDVVTHLWWGANATLYNLYRDGALIYSEPLLASTPATQQITYHVSGEPNGHYTYTAELLNAAGTAQTGTVAVNVTDALPGKPVLSSDNWDGDGAFTLAGDLWWGTNATGYRLLQNGQQVAGGDLTDHTPSGQHVSVPVSGLAPGDYTYTLAFYNAYGVTLSNELTVTVWS